MSAAFTPGPWKVLDDEEDGRDYVRVRGTQLGERYKIANALFVGGHAAEVAEARANARLIAAAPELYEALNELRNYAMLSEEHCLLADKVLALARGEAQPTGGKNND